MAKAKDSTLPDLSQYHVLVTCVDGEIYTELYPTYEAAFGGILHDFEDNINWAEEEPEWKEFYENNKDEHGWCDEHDGFEIRSMSAWAHQHNGTHWTWEIKSIETMYEEMENRMK